MINPTKNPNINPQKKSLSVPAEGSGLMKGRNAEVLPFGNIMLLGPSDPSIKSSSSSSESPSAERLVRREKRPRRRPPVPDNIVERMGLLRLFPEMAARRRGSLVLRFILNSEYGPCVK